MSVVVDASVVLRLLLQTGAVADDLRTTVATEDLHAPALVDVEVVTHPVQNTASLALLRALGARRVGSVDEEYEGVGRIVSDLYYAPIAGADERLVQTTRAGRRAVR